MDSRTAKALDDHITGRFNPNAPFNQPDPDPKWECPRCDWTGDDAVETEFRTVSEFWGAKQNHISYEYTCPNAGCGHEVIAFERPDPDDDYEEEWDDEDEDEEDEEEWDDEDE